jgi:hypothetical protein
MPRALDPAKRTEARRLRTKGKSLSEIQNALGISYGSAQRFTRGVAPEKERAPEIRGKIAAAKRPRHDAWSATVTRGECCTAGCARAGCPIRYGECHCACGEKAPLATDDDRRRNYVRGEPRLYVQGHQRGGDTLMAAGDGEALLAALEQCDMTRIEASRRAKLGKGVVADLLGLEGYRLRRERCERIVGVLRAEFEAKELDASRLTLEQLFTEARLASEPPVGERGPRVKRRRPAIPPSERSDCRDYDSEVTRRAEERRQLETYSREEAATLLLDVAPSVVTRWLQLGRLPTLGVRDVRRFGRQLRKSEGAWDVFRRDPVRRARFALAHGAQDPFEIQSRVELALTKLARIRVGTGRPPGPAPASVEWAARFETIKAELEAAYEQFHVDGDPPPTQWEIARLVAYEDYELHPERWSYAPGDHPREAQRRVWEAVKTLQIAVRETRAA